jgi:methionine sulfoxide reductase heme-binding subunit
MTSRLAHWPALCLCSLILVELLIGHLRLLDGSLQGRLGQASALLLIACLACRPIAKRSGQREWLLNRRPLGLWSWLFLCAHMGCYLLQTKPDQGWLNELTSSPNLWFGAGAAAILASLALTSNRWSQAYLKKRWKKLHRLVYLAGALVGFHLFLSGKASLPEMLLFSLGYLLVMWPRRNEIFSPKSVNHC